MLDLWCASLLNMLSLYYPFYYVVSSITPHHTFVYLSIYIWRVLMWNPCLQNYHFHETTEIIGVHTHLTFH